MTLRRCVNEKKSRYNISYKDLKQQSQAHMLALWCLTCYMRMIVWAETNARYVIISGQSMEANNLWLYKKWEIILVKVDTSKINKMHTSARESCPASIQETII